VKRTFNAGLMMLACLAAAAVRDALAPGGSTAIIHVSSVTHGTGPLSVVAAGVVLVAVSETLLMGLLRQVAPATPWRAHFGDMEDWILNAVDLAAGAVLAVAWVVSPVFFGLATLLVLLLQRSAVHRHLVEMSQSDAKTGVANPVHWRTVTTRAVTRAQHVGGSMGVLMVDLDHFKAINDTCGHLAGDAVLTAVADTLRLAVRPGDLVGRFGGEEFAVLLDGAGIGDASSTAARIQQRIGMLGARSGPTGDPIYVTASIGLAVLGVHGDDLNELLAAADQALYQAKAAGRDRVELAIPTEKHPHPVPVF
jgi:diguanylate cyclase (GGDEF)-like protein